ncbi:DUF4097 family beta strand repeat-containing protein [Ruania halotolerans]|uniref:DUF4097 family beta strand repeat-containing protein n=1 Tax=Ruania halotolerans TaxID=2897773 RepID=UPI001E477537|nr:DUF4097 family beta strand repeat-containing protein [Ruania halotolerans]UFU07731.1 DUF4097 domain-containing protein [Ruania halotolerans]
MTSDHSFAVDGPVRLLVRMRSSDVTVTAADTDTASVTFSGNPDLAARIRVEFVGDRLEVEAPPARTGLFSFGGSKMTVSVVVPLGSDAELETGSGNIRTTGELAVIGTRTGSGSVRIAHGTSVDATCGSGAVTIESAVSVRVTTGSGRIAVTEADDAQLRTGSGTVTAESVRTIEASTGSGDVIIRTLGVSATLKSGSGNHVVRHVARGEVTAKNASGDISVGVAHGSAAMLDCSTVSGKVRSELEPTGAPDSDADAVALRLRSVSGNITVRRA